MCCSGILYAHRNEDIVNYKPRIQEDREGIIESDDVLQQPSTLATWKRKSDGVNSRKSADCLGKSTTLRNSLGLLYWFLGDSLFIQLGSRTTGYIQGVW
ncbi:hypothetical protein LIER_36460 [Lithospermum erythrorhizon]|uniref:Uncharacterized protein n=1 Tax=Lithospermum erythrorhizon TaxID=34254 RepID=A0AAV3P7A3_LITER